MHSSYLQLGHLHIPVFGVVIAIGIMAALALSQRTARYAGLAPEAVWNVGMTAIVSAFVISRLLLVVFNLRSFLEYPMLVLALPSLTTLGILSTVLFMLGYIRWRKLPLLPLLDAAAPCAALLWASLSVRRYVEGTRDGMPMRLSSSASGILGCTVYPVEIYTLITASSLCMVLLLLMAVRLLQARYNVGEVIGIALISAGLAIFFIDFYRLPSELPGLWLDPAQIIGIAMVLIGGALLHRARRQARPEDRNEANHAV